MDVTARLLTPADEAAVQRVLESNPEYARRVEGGGPRSSAAAEVFSARPPSVAATQKVDLGLWAGPDLLAFADILLGWPDADFAHIGLLMTDGARQGEGLGRRMHDAVVELVRAHPTIARLRLAIVDTNADLAEPFWTRLGYAPTGEAVPYAAGSVESTARVWTRPLEEASSDPLRLTAPAPPR